VERRPAYDGTATILQPLILPLFGGKSAHEFLAAFSEQPEKNGYELVRAHWQKRLPAATSKSRGGSAVHDGVVEGTALPEKATRAAAASVPAASSPAAAAGGRFSSVPTRPSGTALTRTTAGSRSSRSP
jgi:molybdopterin-containing oxidoreductase family iron-sulfur binding subunit